MTESAEAPADAGAAHRPAEAADGLTVLRGRMQRGSRMVRPPRNPVERSPDPVAPPTPDLETHQPGAVAARSASPVQEDSARSLQAEGGPATRQPQAERRRDPDIAGEELTSNLAVRVRRSLDRRLDTLLHELKMSGTKSSKVEIIELLLWELPLSVDDQLRRRLREFRTATRRDW